MIERLHYISQATPGSDSSGNSHLHNIEAACRAGVKWVQLRLKDTPVAEVKRLAEEAKSICQRWGARLIINDYPQIALEVDADGLHLGLEDMPIQQARQLVGNMIIGQTANTFEDVWRHSQNGADYVGLGPYAFTTTKKKLSPLLGLDGYRHIIRRCREAGIRLPIIAVGGIALEDIPALLETGVHGIAASSLLTSAEGVHHTTAAVLQTLETKRLAHVTNSR